jgi:hypothetical protein
MMSRNDFEKVLTDDFSYTKLPAAGAPVTSNVVTLRLTKYNATLEIYTYSTHKIEIPNSATITLLPNRAQITNNSTEGKTIHSIPYDSVCYMVLK